MLLKSSAQVGRQSCIDIKMFQREKRIDVKFGRIGTNHLFIERILTNYIISLMKIINRKFNRDYQELERYEAGISLTGAEVKSIRAGRMKLEDSFVRILGSEVYLVNAEIPIYEYSRPQEYDLRRTRKLLLHKSEILRIKGKISSHSGLTLAPISCYNKHGLVKLEIALAKGRKSVDKKNLEKKRDIERQEKREVKEYLKS